MIDGPKIAFVSMTLEACYLFKLMHSFEWFGPRNGKAQAFGCSPLRPLERGPACITLLSFPLNHRDCRLSAFAGVKSAQFSAIFQGMRVQ